MKLKKRVTSTNRSRQRNHQSRKPVLRFSPTAWAKLLFLRDYGETEVGGFGITASEDLLFVRDLKLVRQVCSWAHVAFEDDSVADLFDEQVDAGLRPEQFGRIWMHTHPGNCPLPSPTDEQTFARVFGQAEWAVMFILARGGKSYARLQMNSGPGASLRIPVEIDYSQSFTGCDHESWESEYLTHVQSHNSKTLFNNQDEDAVDFLENEFRFDLWDETDDLLSQTQRQEKLNDHDD